MKTYNKYLRYAKRFINLLRDIWLIIGLSLVLLIFFEIACNLLLYIKTNPYVDGRVKADGYENATWLEDYFEEFELCLSSMSWKPYVYFKVNPFNGQYIKLDHNGIRRTSFPEIIGGTNSRPLEIFMFGGSTLWGTGARDNYTIPSLLGKALSEHQIRAKITNFGEGGRVSTQEVIELFLKLQKGNIPDMVIFYDGVNDTFSAFQNGIPGIPQNEWNRKKEFILLHRSRYKDLDKFFFLSVLERSGIGTVLKLIMRRIKKGYDNKEFRFKGKQNIEEDIVKIYLSNMKIVDSLGKAYGFTSIFYWQPVIYTKNILTKYEKQEVEAKGKEVREFYDRTYTAMKEQNMKCADYHFYNISDMFAKTDQPFFIDFCHLTEAGNQMIANRMKDDIIEIISKAGPKK